MLALTNLRAHAISQTFFETASLGDALERMMFVQADPIRSPARAQDLILRHRVEGYRAGDLERKYPMLDIEEDSLYAYGFVPRRIWQLLQPRRPTGLTDLEKRVLKAVQDVGETHPRELEPVFGGRRVTNDWGGTSAATTRTLEHLRHRGLLRIARREKGIRIYSPSRPFDESLTPAERLCHLIATTASILAPIRERTLRAIVTRFRRWGNPRKTVDELLKTGRLARCAVDGYSYVWPLVEETRDRAPRRVRILAPFDPLVWDRGRFEQFWGWSYRFEAYTPRSKRVRGYYAMPLLWGDRVIGWANVDVVEGGRLSVGFGFVEKRPSASAFSSELEREIESLKTFLDLKSPVSRRWRGSEDNVGYKSF